MTNQKIIKKALSELGKLGGKSGKGKSKVRGDSEYYRAIAKKRWASKSLQNPTEENKKDSREQ